MDVQGKRILIIGLARSGLAAAKFLTAKGAIVTLTDRKKAGDLKEILEQEDLSGVYLYLGGHPTVAEGDFDLVVVSPGVPLTIAPLEQARRSAIPVISEIELAYGFARTPIVAITGTNGKTTTTTLIGEIYRYAGYAVSVAGNIGVPLISEVENYGPGDIIIAEVSSFQLETIAQFRPKVSVILNYTPDHLDRHGSFEQYVSSKERIFLNQGQGDFTVLNYDDEEVRQGSKKTRGKVIFFSRRHILEEGVFVSNDQVVVKKDGQEYSVIETKAIGIKGLHNLENALAAVAAASSLGIPADKIAHILRTFQGVPHRMELVGEVNGVRYINDSKGTNPDAAIKALDSYGEPIILIAGGYDKGSDFDEFACKVKEKAKAVVLLGATAEAIGQSFEQAGFTNFHKVAGLEEAVRKANRLAKPGDLVLLSPACASWDMFTCFEERGDLFKKLVIKLKGE